MTTCGFILGPHTVYNPAIPECLLPCVEAHEAVHRSECDSKGPLDYGNDRLHSETDGYETELDCVEDELKSLGCCGN